MSTWVYDIEVYPNLFVALFFNNETKEYKLFIFDEENPNGLQELISFLSQEGLTLVGHNSLHYDDLILKAVLLLDGRNITNKDLKRLSDKLIQDRQDTINPEFWKKVKRSNFWVSIDTLELTRVNRLRLGLKYLGVLLRMPSIEDLPYSPETFLSEKEKQEVIQYLYNDVKTTVALSNHQIVQDKLKIRRLMMKLYKLPARTLTLNDTGVGKVILDVVYSQSSGISISDLRNMEGSPIEKVQFSDLVFWDKYNFSSPKLIDFLENVKNDWIYPNKPFRFEIEIGGVIYDLGKGGLHSRDSENPGVYRSDDDFLLIDADVASMYPSIIITNELHPPHLDKEIFVETLKGITEERLKAKKLGKSDPFQKAKADGLKITINSIFGLLNSKYYWLYSPKTALQVTINGQLMLLSLIDRLTNNGIEVISANTDGVLAKVSRNQSETYKQICKEWERDIGLILEFAYYDLYVRRDVNNYLAVTEGKVKTKGVFYDNSQLLIANDLMKGRSVPAVVPKGLVSFFKDGIEPSDFVRSHDLTVYDFLIAPRVGHQFEVYLEEIKDGHFSKEQLQKTNRFVVTKKGGRIYKQRKSDSNSKINIIAGKTVKILNQITDEFIHRDLDLDYDYYSRLIEDVVGQITPKYNQPVLFA